MLSFNQLPALVSNTGWACSVLPPLWGQRSEKSHTHTHLCEHGFSILGDHRALIAVQRHKVVVERLLGVLQYVVELSGATLEYTPEVPGNQRSADSFSRQRKRTITQKDLKPPVHQYINIKIGQEAQKNTSKHKGTSIFLGALQHLFNPPVLLCYSAPCWLEMAFKFRKTYLSWWVRVRVGVNPN